MDCPVKITRQWGITLVPSFVTSIYYKTTKYICDCLTARHLQSEHCQQWHYPWKSCQSKNCLLKTYRQKLYPSQRYANQCRPSRPKRMCVVWWRPYVASFCWCYLVGSPCPWRPWWWNGRKFLTRTRTQQAGWDLLTSQWCFSQVGSAITVYVLCQKLNVVCPVGTIIIATLACDWSRQTIVLFPAYWLTESQWFDQLENHTPCPISLRHLHCRRPWFICVCLDSDYLWPSLR